MVGTWWVHGGNKDREVVILKEWVHGEISFIILKRWVHGGYMER